MEHWGYMGKILEVDLSRETVRTLPLPSALSGRALAAQLMLESLSGGEGALSEENVVVIATALLTLTGAPASARFDIASLSPRDGCPAIANCGGALGLMLRRAGYDALLLRGRCRGLRLLEIDNGYVNFCDAESLRGVETDRCTDLLSKEKPGSAVLCIGPAGENYVNFASVFANGHSTGRAGFGAVLGWKNLKAIRIKGEGKLPLCDEERVRALSCAWAASLREARREEGDNCCTACPLHCARQGRGEDPLLDALGMDAIAAGRAAERFAGCGLSREELFTAMAHGRIDVNERRSGERENKLKSGKRRKGSFEAVLRAFELPDDEESALFCRRFTEAVSVSGQCMFTLKALKKGELPMLDMLQAVTGKPYTLEDFVAMGEESLRLERELKARFEK